MQPLACPACRQTMAKLRCPRTQGGEVVLDLCYSCQGLWFDQHESQQIAPGGVIELFREIHARRDTPRLPLPAALHCPRCGDGLRHGTDLVKPGGRFNYHRCPQQHGRFVAFSQFLIEKGFIRQLNPAEIARLAVEVRQIRCNGCGAPVDLQRDPACPHCRAPIALLDPQAVDNALARYRQAEQEQRVAPGAEVLGDLIVANARERKQLRQKTGNRNNDIELLDLLVDGAGFILRLLD
ncbi:MAG: zf-TFIIB domain-containing protein [Azonexus sp.]|nr:zf-TFIIB domain-containing protein [Azonexus sp.]MCK6412032.1 zf-TFIIB domain-containing protein [Azonexus sp.]